MPSSKKILRRRKGLFGIHFKSEAMGEPVSQELKEGRGAETPGKAAYWFAHSHVPC